jgi:16S rRNA processing protein RimM
MILKGAGAMATEFIVVGRVLTAHGIHGRVIVEPMTENPGRFESGSKLLMEGEGEEPGAVMTVHVAQPYKGKLLVAFEGITDRSGALMLRGRYLTVSVDDLPEPEAGEYYHHQLIGLRAVDVSGEELGIVREVLALPAQDVIVIVRSGTEYMVPFVDEFIKKIDLDEEMILIEKIPGLFE